MTSARRFLLCTAGVAALETALLFPVVSLLLYGGVEVARALSLRNSLQYAVERAARCAVVASTTTCDTADHITAYAASQVYGAAVTTGAFTVAYPSCGVSVTASMLFTPLVPTNVNYTLSAMACRPYQ